MENKDNKEIALFQLLMAYKYGTRVSIFDMKYRADDKDVVIYWGDSYENSARTYVNVAYDSAAAMIFDVVRHIEGII